MRLGLDGRWSRLWLCAAAALASALTLLACGGDDLVDSRFGSLVVNIETAGTNVDPDGYRLTIVGPSFNFARDVTLNETITVSTVREGSYTIEIAGLALNCTVPENPRVVSLAPDATATVTFTVTCG